MEYGVLTLTGISDQGPEPDLRKGGVGKVCVNLFDAMTLSKHSTPVQSYSSTRSVSALAPSEIALVDPYVSVSTLKPSSPLSHASRSAKRAASESLYDLSPTAISSRIATT